MWVEYPSEWNRADEVLEEIGFLESTNNRMNFERASGHTIGCETRDQHRG